MYLLCFSAIDVSCIVITLSMLVIVYMVSNAHDTILTSIIDLYGVVGSTQETCEEYKHMVVDLKKEIEDLKKEKAE